MPAEKSFAWGVLVLLAATTTASAVEVSNSVFTSRWNAEGNQVTTTVTITSSTLNSAPAPSVPETSLPAAVPTNHSVNSATLGPASTPTVAPAAAADAFLNFGGSPYVESASLATGSPAAWYLSPTVKALFGGTPNAQQQQQFVDAVVADVTKTYQLSGLDIKLTTNPAATAAHSLSAVSGASYAANDQAIGITDVGNSGFSFIDKFGVPTSVDQLEWAVAHNISHELMHAFGVATHHDESGKFLDAAITPWSLLVDKNARLSSDAVADLKTHRWNVNTNGSSSYSAEMASLGHPTHTHGCSCQRCRHGAMAGPVISAEMASPIPEPTTVALWGLATVALIVQARRRRAV